jgi:hypothetical protein
MDLNIPLILKKSVEEYVSQFGTLEIKKEDDTPYYSCEVNQIPTIIFPIAVMDYKKLGIEEIEKHFRDLKHSNQVTRLEVQIDKEGNVELMRPIQLNDYRRSRANDKS